MVQTKLLPLAIVAPPRASRRKARPPRSQAPRPKAPAPIQRGKLRAARG